MANNLCSDKGIDFKAPACSSVPNPFTIVEKDARYVVFDLSGNDITDRFVITERLDGLVTFEHKESGNIYLNA